MKGVCAMPKRMIVPWLLLLAFAPAVAAQQPQGPRGPRGSFALPRRGFGEGVVSLIGMREVQQELELSDAQRELLDALRADLRTQVRVAFRGESRRGSGAERPGREEVRNRIREINRQGEELVMLVLEPEQAKRLKQLRLQQEGTRAFDRPETAKAVGLTEAQLTKIREIRNGAQQDGEDPSPQQRRARRRQAESDILAVLTSEQKQRWEEMQGEKFQFPRPARFGRNRSDGRRPRADQDRRDRENPE
jgi:hypothetical protein